MPQSNEKSTYIHVGYPKSGSTTLQKQLFSKHTEINNLGIFPTDNVGKDTDYIDYDSVYLNNTDLQKFYHNLVMLEGIQYHNSENPSLFHNKIRNLATNRTDKITVFSNERFVSAFYAHDDLREKANRLKELFPDGNIIFIIRNQVSLIKSQYRDHPTDPRSFAIGSPVSIDEWIEIAYEAESVNFLESLQYYDIIEYYVELFGQKNVDIFLLENLSQNTEKFATSLAAYLGIDSNEVLELLETTPENTGVSKQFNKYRRLRRHIRSTIKPSRAPEPIKMLLRKVDKTVRDAVREGSKEEYDLNSSSLKIINSVYSEQNEMLDKQYNLDLTNFDYPGTK